MKEPATMDSFAPDAPRHLCPGAPYKKDMMLLQDFV